MWAIHLGNRLQVHNPGLSIPSLLTSSECWVTVECMQTLILSPAIKINYVWPVFTIMTRAISYLLTMFRHRYLTCVENIGWLQSMLPVYFGLIGKPWSGSVSQALFYLVFGLVALCPLVYHKWNNLFQTLFHPACGDVLCS